MTMTLTNAELREQEQNFINLFKVQPYYVYELENQTNGRKYYGITKDLIDRLKHHRMDLNAGRHGNKYLMEDMRKGKLIINASVVDICFSRQMALEVENELIQADKTCYNVLGTSEGGRPAQPKRNVKQALELYDNRETNGMSVNDIAKLTSVPRSTIYNELKKRGDKHE